MKRLIPAIPLSAALAVLFTVPAYADAIAGPGPRIIEPIIAVVIVLVLFCVSVAAVLISVFARRAKSKKEDNKK